jgi:hypothetical protein
VTQGKQFLGIRVVMSYQIEPLPLGQSLTTEVICLEQRSAQAQTGYLDFHRFSGTVKAVQ